MNRPQGGGWVIGVDTSARGGGVALLAPGGEPAGERRLPPEVRSSLTLLSALEDLLAAKGLRAGDLAAVGVALGPGSFTGLRVGLSTGKGMALGLGCALYGVSSLEALARAAAEEWEAGGGPAPRWILAFRDAWHGELFTALFGPGPAEPTPGAPRWPRAREDAVERPADIRPPAEGAVLLAGAGSDLPPALAAAAEGARVRHVEVETSARSVARLAREALRAGRPSAGPGLQPFYGRRPRAQTQWGAPEG